MTGFGIYLAALGFFLGLSLLSGLGVRLGIKAVKLLPEKQSWIYFGAVFFIFDAEKKGTVLLDQVGFAR